MRDPCEDCIKIEKIFCKRLCYDRIVFMEKCLRIKIDKENKKILYEKNPCKKCIKLEKIYCKTKIHCDEKEEFNYYKINLIEKICDLIPLALLSTSIAIFLFSCIYFLIKMRP